MPTFTNRLLSCCLVLGTCTSALGQDMTFAPVSVEDDKETKAELQEALKAYKRRDFLRSSLILYRVVSRNDVAISPIEQKAEYTLGKTLYRLGLYQASLGYFDRVIQVGPEHRYFKATCKWLYYLSRKILGEPNLLDKITRYRPDDCPEEFRSEMSFLLGQGLYKKGKIKDGLNYLKGVKQGSRYFPKAKFLEGLSHVRLDDPKPAVASFKDLMRFTVQSNNLTEDLKYFYQLSILSMARVFFSTNQFPTSVKYYDQVGLDSPFWLEALFEASWTFFRMNNHPKALGHLHTLSSPFFRDEYMPEAPILKAVIFYANCNYEKTRETISDFRLVYEPLRDEIKGYIDNMPDPTEFYKFILKLQDTETALSPRVEQILSAAFRDKELKRINAYIKELDRELKLIRDSRSSWSKSQLAESIIQETELVKSMAVGDAGKIAKERLSRVVKELDELINQSIKIEFEVATAEKGILENRLNSSGFKNKVRASGNIYATDDEHIYWPFTGEYWRDELGYYLYTIKSKCSR